MYLGKMWEAGHQNNYICGIPPKKTLFCVSCELLKLWLWSDGRQLASKLCSLTKMLSVCVLHVYLIHIYLACVYVYVYIYVVISYIPMTKFKSLLKLVHVTIPGTFLLAKVLITLRNSEISIPAYNIPAFQFSITLLSITCSSSEILPEVLSAHTVHLLLFCIFYSRTCGQLFHLLLPRPWILMFSFPFCRPSCQPPTLCHPKKCLELRTVWKEKEQVLWHNLDQNLVQLTTH